MDRISVLLIGDKEIAEFREPFRQLSKQTNLRYAPDPIAALTLIGNGLPPVDAVILAQSRPGQYAPSAIDRVRRAGPLVPIIAMLGTWCEGESRNGHPLPGVIRIYWHQWAARWAAELKRISAGRCPVWGLPVTVTADEWVEHASPKSWPRRQGMIAIRARHAVTYNGLAGICRGVGYAAVWLRTDLDVQVEGVTAVLWDDICCDRAAAAEIADLAKTIGPAPIIALLHAPRIDDYDRARAVGVAGIVSKPLLLDDLFWQLDRATVRRDERAAA